MTTWPSGVTTKTVEFDLRGPAHIEFLGPALTVPADNAVTAVIMEAASTSDGTGSIVLPCTDTGGVTPTGWGYDVTIRRGRRVEKGTMQLHAAASSPVDLADVLELDQNVPDAGVAYVPIAQRGQPNGVATLDSGGKVPDAQLPSSAGGDIVAADITDATATGLAVMTAVNAAAARTAIGAGTSSLALGSTSTTAYAGDLGADLADRTITLVLGPADPVPGGTPAGTVIVRTT